MVVSAQVLLTIYGVSYNTHRAIWCKYLERYGQYVAVISNTIAPPSIIFVSMSHLDVNATSEA